MDVAEHPAVIATTDLIGQYDALVADGKLHIRLAYALLAADILGAGVEVCRQGGPSEVSQHLIELASGFAVARRHDALVDAFKVPDNLDGLVEE